MRLKWTFLDIFGQFGTLRDNLEDSTSLDHLDRFPNHFQPFSPIIVSLKKTSYGRTDGLTDRSSYRDAWTHLKIYLVAECSIGHIELRAAKKLALNTRP